MVARGTTPAPSGGDVHILRAIEGESDAQRTEDFPVQPPPVNSSVLV